MYGMPTLDINIPTYKLWILVYIVITTFGVVITIAGMSANIIAAIVIGLLLVMFSMIGILYVGWRQVGTDDTQPLIHV